MALVAGLCHVMSRVYVSCVGTYVYTPGGLLRKPPLKCARASSAQIARRSLTRIRPCAGAA